MIRYYCKLCEDASRNVHAVSFSINEMRKHGVAALVVIDKYYSYFLLKIACLRLFVGYYRI